jgi:rhodanese-related sulfurtransferase
MRHNAQLVSAYDGPGTFSGGLLSLSAIVLQQVPDDPPGFQLVTEAMFDWKKRFPTRMLIIYDCGGGGRSAFATESVQKMGYKNVRSMDGGFKAWKAAGLPVTK